MTPNNFALTSLSANPEYFEDVIRLIEESFHYSETHHYEIDFAPLVNPLNFENCFLFIDSETNTVAAHLAICKRVMIKNNFELSVALVGGIATNKKFRGLGLFQKLMDHAIQSFQKEVGLFILWSELENLYEKFSFYRTGGLIETGKRNFSASERPSGYEKTKFPALSDKEFKTIINLYSTFNEKYFFTVKREDKDWSIIREMNSIDLYVKKNSSDEIIKYFCVNKGRDLTNIIHEISCKPSEMSIILKDLENFKLWLPETEISTFMSSEVFYTAFMRFGSLPILNIFLSLLTNDDLKVLSLDEQVRFQFKDKEFGASKKEFLQYLFGPKPLAEFENYKLSLYIPGTDSI